MLNYYILFDYAYLHALSITIMQMQQLKCQIAQIMCDLLSHNFWHLYIGQIYGYFMSSMEHGPHTLKPTTKFVTNLFNSAVFVGYPCCQNTIFKTKNELSWYSTKSAAPVAQHSKPSTLNTRQALTHSVTNKWLRLFDKLITVIQCIQS